MIKLIHDDCRNAMKELIDEGVSVDLVVTSPPYDNLRTYKDEIDWNFDVFKEIADLLYQIVAEGGVVVWVVNDATINGSETGTSFKQALYFKEIGFRLHDTMIYKKKGMSFPESNRYYPNFEYMFVFSKGKPSTVHLIDDKKNKVSGSIVSTTERQPDGSMKIGSGRKKKSKIKEYGVRFNVWEYHTGIGMNPYLNEHLHPAMFPFGLARDHIVSWSNPDDLVLDPFMGGGTVGMACKELNRDFIGIEKIDEYFEISKENIKKVPKKLEDF